MEKPVCGGGREVGEYDLGLHVAGLCAGFPVAAKKVKWLKLLPTAFFSLSDPCLPDLFVENYPPMPGVIMMAALFVLFVIEMWMNNKIGGHSHGGAKGFESSQAAPPRPCRTSGGSSFETDGPECEKGMAQRIYEQKIQHEMGAAFADISDLNLPPSDSEMPLWFMVFYEQYVRQRLEMISMIKSTNARGQSNPQMAINEKPHWDVEGQLVDPSIYKKMSMNITLLEGGILFHSVFVGMTISITIEGYIVLLVAILFHQMFEGLGLGSRIAAVPYPKGSVKPWLLVFAFGTTAPIGQAIGLLTRNTYDPNSAFGLITVGVFNSISSGLLIYAALVDLLAEDFLSEESSRTLTSREKKTAFFWVLLGAVVWNILRVI
ncbi:hypothetical protein DL768_011172 [Monosporascus sp. mg162]|nr:hypothetical protein DL768_011172 [Monosporascus sp. mg162]